MEQTILTGAITTKDETGAQITRLILLRCTSDSTTNEQILIACDQQTRQAVSATKNCKTTTALTESSWNNMQAALYMQIIQKCLAAVAKCKLLKNGKAPKSSKTQIYSSVSPQGIMLNYVGSVQSYSFEISKPQIKLNPTYISINGSDGTVISLTTIADIATIKCYNDLISNIPWVETKSQSMTLQDITTTMSEEEELMRRHVKTMEEVALTKDTSWLQYKKYYVIDNEATAEQLISALEQYDGLISYDVETTGLNMNMYCEIGSPLKKQLEEYNASVEPSLRIRADRLTGFSFCVKPNEAYYFPCFHRKFDNLFKDINEPTTAKIVQTIKARYTVGDLRDRNNYMAQFIRSTPAEEWGSDVILMERCRDIFEKHKILAHHGSFEYKVNLCYGCDLNLVEDTMILHQLAFKWKNVRTHSGEPSNLKYLSKTILGIDQLSLEDFFADFKEAEQAAEVRSVSATSKKKKKAKKASIDFSYMGKEETRCYAPADVDLTLQLWYKFKVDAQREFPDLDYLYGVEIIMACAVGYAEFYGLHINEKKIDNAKYDALVTMAKKEHEIRVLNNLCSSEEQVAFDALNALGLDTTPHEELQTALDKLNGIIEAESNLNLGSPGQVADLLYAKYNWSPDADGKKSMGKKVIKQYEKLKDDEGKPLYPEVLLYRDWKDNSTLITKFFDKLQDFMYPGGNIFTSFGQIACATGRMSSKKPNFQQMPSSITKIIEPRAGYVFFDGDFSQIEYRCLCALAGETSLIEAFNDPDMDYHQKMASLMYDIPYALVPDSMRKSAKTFNFGIPYGMGFQSLAIQLHGNKSRASVDDAKEKYELYFKEQPKVRQFFSDVKEQARYNEYTKTYFGRRRYFKFTDENGNVSEKFVAQGLRQAGNAVIQGCLDGNTRIQTKERGIVRIKDVVNQTLHVWDGKEWTLGDIMPSGLKQKCIVTFNNGQQFICSPDHKFLVRSSKGNERFVRCEDLVSSTVNRMNPHRVVINRQYEPSDAKYNSRNAYIYTSSGNGSNNVFLEDVGDSFKIGVILGRLASDGIITLRDNGGNYVTQLIAEHELSIAPVLREYMAKLNCTYIEKPVREGRNECVNHLRVSSTSLTNEIADLNIKYELHDEIFKDTEMLRGFLRGMFDGDGGISGKTITLVFGSHFDFDTYSHDIQKALQFFGIRSHVRSYENDRTVVVIKTQDNQKFLDTIGFINKEKQQKGRELTHKLDEHVFGPCLIVENVEITDEQLPMYDVCNTERGYYVADGIITHNTARDVFGIAAARAFQAIRNNGLLGKVRMCNFIHDEVLYEISAEVNVLAVVGMILEAMQLVIPGFPPLYVGGGIGNAWKTAKGAMNEIHPTLGMRIIDEAHQGILPAEFDGTTDRVYKYFDNKVYSFRQEKVATYIAEVERDLRTGKDVLAIDPAIGKLLGLQFEGGVEKIVNAQIDEYKHKCAEKLRDPDAKKLSEFEAKIVPMRLKQFIIDFPDAIKEALVKAGFTLTPESDLNNLMVIGYLDSLTGQQYEEDEDDVAYDDDNDEEDDYFDYDFELIDESKNDLFGVSIIDIARQFGMAVIPSRGVCCIYIGDKTQKQLQQLANLFEDHQCNPDDEGAMEVQFVRADNYILKPDIFVNELTTETVTENLIA